MGAIANYETVLPTAVANTGTVTVPAYPAGSNQASLIGSTGGQVAIDRGAGGVFPQAASGAGTIALTFGSSTITITNNSGFTWPAGARLAASFGRVDLNGSYNLVIGTGHQQAAAGDGSNPNYDAPD